MTLRLAIGLTAMTAALVISGAMIPPVACPVNIVATHHPDTETHFTEYNNAQGIQLYLGNPDWNREMKSCASTLTTDAGNKTALVKMMGYCPKYSIRIANQCNSPYILKSIRFDVTRYLATDLVILQPNTQTAGAPAIDYLVKIQPQNINHPRTIDRLDQREKIVRIPSNTAATITVCLMPEPLTIGRLTLASQTQPESTVVLTFNLVNELNPNEVVSKSTSKFFFRYPSQ